MGNEIMDNQLFNHRALTAWEKSANEREARVAILITLSDKKGVGMEAVQMYTAFPAELAIHLLEQLIVSLKNPDGHKAVGGGDLNHPSS